MSTRWPIMRILVSIGAVGASPQIRKMLPPCDFFDCPVLSLPFFSILRPGRTAGPIFTLYVCCKDKKLSYRKDSAHRRSLCLSRSFKVDTISPNRKPECNFLLVNNTNLHTPFSSYRSVAVKISLTEGTCLLLMHLFLVTSTNIAINHILLKTRFAVQGPSRSPTLLPIESPNATTY